MQYWFNVRTREVEEHDDPRRARSEDLLGPYESAKEAEAALETARARTQEWDEQDAEWETGEKRTDRDEGNQGG